MLATNPNLKGEGHVMVRWLTQRLIDWVRRIQQREIDRLHAEGLRLKAEQWWKADSTLAGGAPAIERTEKEDRPRCARTGELLDDAE
jgi:hypothetical protein